MMTLHLEKEKELSVLAQLYKSVNTFKVESLTLIQHGIGLHTFPDEHFCKHPLSKACSMYSQY